MTIHQKRTRVLLSNDDGVDAKGLVILANTLKETADVHVVAPDRNRSGASNSLTVRAPLYIKNLDNGMISVEGTPTDCVYLAMTRLLSEKPDAVISGINQGSNLGDDVWYSGTVAAAMEGRLRGVPAIAISLVGRKGHYYDTAARVGKILMHKILSDPLPADTILNVNVPNLPYEKIKGFTITRLGARRRTDLPMEQHDPRGERIYWVGASEPEQDAGPGTDFYAIREGFVSITPLRVDLTHDGVFEQLVSWISPIKLEPDASIDVFVPNESQLCYYNKCKSI